MRINLICTHSVTVFTVVYFQSLIMLLLLVDHNTQETYGITVLDIEKVRVYEKRRTDSLGTVTFVGETKKVRDIPPSTTIRREGSDRPVEGKPFRTRPQDRGPYENDGVREVDFFQLFFLFSSLLFYCLESFGL